MKIAAIQPLSLSDFPPYCAAIIFTIGCNFRCPYCHNKNLWDESHQQITSQELFDFLHTKTKQLDGVVITGGEPTIQPRLLSCIKKIKNLGYKIKLNTNGSNPECLQKLIAENLVDYIAMDIKAPLGCYPKICGTPIAATTIKSSIDLIALSTIPHEFRTVWNPKWLTESDIAAIKFMLPENSNYIARAIADTG